MAENAHVAVAGADGNSILVAGLHIDRYSAIVASLSDDVQGEVFERAIHLTLARAVQNGFTAVIRIQQRDSEFRAGVLFSATVPEADESATRLRMTTAFDDLAPVMTEAGLVWGTSETLDELLVPESDLPLIRYGKAAVETTIGQHTIPHLHSVSNRPGDWLFAAMAGWEQIDLACFPCQDVNHRDWLARNSAACRVLSRRERAAERVLEKAGNQFDLALAEETVTSSAITLRASNPEDMKRDLNAFLSPQQTPVSPHESWRLTSTELPVEVQAFVALDYSEEALDVNSIEPSLRGLPMASRNLVRLVSSRCSLKRKESTEHTHDLFLSHASVDKPTVRSLAAALTETGISVWLDEEKLLPGRAWQKNLEDAISKSRAAAILIGPHGLGNWETPEVWACTSEFIDRGMPVIPVLLPGVGNDPDVPLFLRQFTWIDMRKGISSEGLEEIRRATFGTK